MIDDLTNKTKYLLSRPSDESIQLRKKNDSPFVVTVKRKDFQHMQTMFRANQFYKRLEEAGIVAENIYNPTIHQGYRRGFYEDEQPQIALMIFHKDQQILHDLMEEFISREIINQYGWKKLRYLIVN